MAQGRLALVEKRKQNKTNKILVYLLVLLLLVAGAYFTVTEFTIQKIEISGNTTYSDAEILSKVTTQHYVKNTLAMVVIHKLTGDNYLPFIDRVDMSIKKPHILKVKVKEGIRAGVFHYMDRNYYFDSDGIAQESRNSLLPGVPEVTGVKVSKIVLGKKIPVKGDYFDTIVLITKKIASYKLDISQIHFESEDDIYLVSGKYQIHIGSTQYLTSKMSRITEILKSVSKKSDSGTIDMHLYTDENDLITFREEE